MERNIRLDWPVLVKEARRRRKEQRLTQQRLAAIAEVSAPTVSRFESGEKNIQLASALAILDTLGMVERPTMEFRDKAERYDFDRDAVLFSGQTTEGDVPLAVSGEALEDHFGATGQGQRARLAAFRAHRPEIEDIALRNYLARKRKRDGAVFITSEDVT